MTQTRRSPLVAVDIIIEVADGEISPPPLAFDHAQILKDYFHYTKTGKRPQ